MRAIALAILIGCAGIEGAIKEHSVFTEPNAAGVWVALAAIFFVCLVMGW